MESINSILKKRVLIIGSNGMLGQKLTDHFMGRKNIELLCSSMENSSFQSEISYKKVNITNKIEVKKLILDFFPDIVINAAAYTNVDKSETERELAWNINVKGVENIALFTWTIDGYLIHISSDYVFDGLKGPYSEKDKTNPISYYGRTKLASENALIASGVRHSSIRTNVLYGPTKYGRPDFVKWVIDSLKGNQTIRIVTDQFNNPAFIDDLVIGISKLSEYQKEDIFNIAGQEVLSRYDFTLRIADYFGLPKELIVPIETSSLNQPARRPLKSGLITLKAQTELGYSPSSIEKTFEVIKRALKL